MVLRTYAFHIQSVTVITEHLEWVYRFAIKDRTVGLQVMSALAFSSGSFEVLIQAQIQALDIEQSDKIYEFVRICLLMTLTILLVP